MDKIKKQLKFNFDAKYAILGIASVFILLIMVYVGYKILAVDETVETSSSKVVIKAASKTYKREIKLDRSGSGEGEYPFEEPVASEEFTPTPTPTEALISQISPTPEENPEIGVGGGEEETITPTPSDLPVATPSFEPPTPTETLLAAGGTEVLTPTDTPRQLPEAGYPNYYIFLAGISLFIIFLAFII